MTIVTAGADGILGGIRNDFDSDTMDGLTSGTLSATSGTQFTLSDSGFPQLTLTAYGSGLHYSNGQPSSGTITSLTYNLYGHESATWSGFSVSIATAWNAILHGDVAALTNLFFSGNDTFNMQNSVFADTLAGGAGNDTFNFGTYFNPETTIDGGSGTDTLNLNGGYGLMWLNVTNVELVHMAAGNDYDIGMQATSTLTIDASALSAAHVARFDSLSGGTGPVLFTGGAGNDIFISGAGNDTFNAGNGSDTFDCTHATSGVTVNLGLTAAQAIGGGLGSDTLNSVETVIGSQYDDTLIGNSGDNFFYAGPQNAFAATAGVDTFNGGDGFDTVSIGNLAYGGSGQGVIVDLRTGAAHLAGTDTFISIEKVIGTQWGDTFYGNSSNNIFEANGGGDTIDDSGATGGMVFNMTAYHVGGDTMPTNTIISTGGGEGTDTLYDFTKIVATHFNDTFYFTSPIVPFVDGGAGNDTISFENATEALGTVSVNQFGSVGTYETRLILGDLSTSVENLTGSPLNDMIMGNESSNVLHGGSGDDAIFGGPGSSTDEGNDKLYGDDGNDSLYSGGGGNTNVDNCLFDGGAGDDTLVGSTAGTDTATYEDAASGVTVNLSITTAQAVGGGLGSDTLTSIENLIGSSFGDTLTGDGGNNVLTAGAGNDTLDISGGGDDKALGGDGNDTIVAGAALTAADRIDGGAGTDTVTLNGNYSAGLTFAAATMINVETLLLAAGNSYKLTMNDANVAAGQTLTVDASALGASNTLTFNGSHETNGRFAITCGAGNDVITGSAGNDIMSGGAGNDSFTLTAGGNDTVSGDNGNDTINFGATLTANDKIDGGAGADTALVSGDYSVGVTFGAATMVNVETLKLAAGFSYKFTSNDATVVAGQSLKIDGSALGAGDTLYFKGSAEIDGQFSITGGAGNDTLFGGAGNDTFTLSGGGNDIAKGGDGSDTFIMGGAFGASDVIDGGSGTDAVKLTGDYSIGVIFASTTMVNVEQISLSAGYNYNLTTSNSTVAAGQSLTVSGSALGTANTLTFDGSHETDGVFNLTGGAGNDVLTAGSGNDTIAGGAGNDIVTGGRGADLITPGSGADHIVYASAAESTGANYDTVSGFNASATDKFDFSFTVSAVDMALTHGALSTASFDTDLAAAVGAGQLGVHHAMLYTPDSGALAGQTFLIVDANGKAGYQAGADFAIHLDHAAGSFDVTDFV